MRWLSVLFYIMSFGICGGAQAKPLVLHLAYYPTVEFAGIFLAQEKGWYRDAGIDLQIKFEGLNITERLLKDEADVAMHSAHEVIRQVAAGHKIKAFAAEYQMNPLSLVTLKDIQRLEELKGKTIGIFTEQEKDFIKVILSSVGLKMSDVTFKPIKSYAVDDLIVYLKEKRYDAIPVWAFNHPVAFALKGLNTRQFPSYNYGFHFYGTVFYAKTSTIEARKKELAKFIEVTKKGWVEAFRSPEEVVRHHVTKWYPREHLIGGDLDLTMRQQQTQMKLSRRFLFEGVGTKGFGEMTPVHWLASLDIARKERLIDNPNLKASDCYTTEVLELVRGSSR